MIFKRSNVTVHFHFSLSCIGEGNGNPLQCSCLQGVKPPVELERGLGIALQAIQQKKALIS